MVCILFNNHMNLVKPFPMFYQNNGYNTCNKDISLIDLETFRVTATVVLFLKDYHHRLVFVTDRDWFEVPIRAIGPRAILDFSEEYHFPICVVKGSTEMTHLVRNVGNSKANFSLQTQR